MMTFLAFFRDPIHSFVFSLTSGRPSLLQSWSAELGSGRWIRAWMRLIHEGLWWEMGQVPTDTKDAPGHKCKMVNAHLVIQQIFIDWLQESHGGWSGFSGRNTDGYVF